MRDQDQGDREAELGVHFAVLCQRIEDYAPFHRLPVTLQLQLQALAEELGVPRPWGPARRD